MGGQAVGGGAGGSWRKPGSREDIWEGFLRKGVVEKGEREGEGEREAEGQTCVLRRRENLSFSVMY